VTPDQLVSGIKVFSDRATLKISPDFMTAYLIMDEEPDLDILDNLPQLLNKAGIIYGTLPIPESSQDGWIIAKGKEPVQGTDGKIELWVVPPDFKAVKDGCEISFAKNKALKKNDIYQGTHCIENIANVTRGQILAQKIPPTTGIAGIDIFGKSAPSTPGKYAAFKPGEGVEVSVDGTKLFSSIDGRLEVLPDGTISVYDHWHIKGSVDAHTGHVNFIGKHLEIDGSIQTGFRVSAKGDVIVNGALEDGCRVEVKGDLTVRGIIRANKTTVQVGGNLICNAIEYSRIKVRGSIEIENYILDARCGARKNICILKERGQVLGGTVMAGGSISLKKVGSKANVRTRLFAGYDPISVKKYNRIVKRIELLNRKAHQIIEGLKKIRFAESRGVLGNQTIRLKAKLKNGLKEIKGYMEQHKKKMEELEQSLGLKQKATIYIKESIRANTILKIENATLKLSQDLEGPLTFVFDQGEILIKEQAEEQQD